VWSDPDGLSPLKNDKRFGLPAKFWNWFHRQMKKQGDDDASKDEALDAFEEWKRQGKPGPDNKGKHKRRDSDDDGGFSLNGFGVCAFMDCDGYVKALDCILNPADCGFKPRKKCLG
jgi:hypothetical protein